MDHKITVYGGASERVECDYGEPFAAIALIFLLDKSYKWRKDSAID